jgi:hypothetical protein
MAWAAFVVVSVGKNASNTQSAPVTMQKIQFRFLGDMGIIRLRSVGVNKAPCRISRQGFGLA